MGGVSYVDDLILLAPTRYSLQKMIHICEVYAEELYGCKWCAWFVYEWWEDVEWVNGMDYLGHTITNDRSDSLVDAVSNDFKIKFNSYMSNFGKIHNDAKNNFYF